MIHYDDCLPMYLSCDASSYGAGDVLSHRMDGQDRLVAFASITLTTAQKIFLFPTWQRSVCYHYQVINVSSMFGCTCIYIITNHQPLLNLLLLNPFDSNTVMSSYKYDLVSWNTKGHWNLSHVPFYQSWSPFLTTVSVIFFKMKFY
jgi:hypothetical protein